VRPVWVQSDFWAQTAAYTTIASMALATDVGWRTVYGLMAWLLTAALGFTTAALGTRQLWYFVGAFIAAVALGTLLARARRLTGAEAEALGGLLSSVDGKSTHDVRVC
jgi:hypothetical protein